MGAETLQIYLHNSKPHKSDEMKDGAMKKITHNLSTITSNKMNKLEHDEAEDEDNVMTPINANKMYPALVRPCLKRIQFQPQRRGHMMKTKRVAAMRMRNFNDSSEEEEGINVQECFC